MWSFELTDRVVVQGPTLAGLWSLAVLLPTLAVPVRRLRDAGYAWAHALWLLVPLAGMIVVALLCAQPSRAAPSSTAASGVQGAHPPSS
ncbi:DUF805 domain-containing protein [Agrococcus citreus]|uniref:DUF805 domain-containing protein n=1 Tax=Agrococcus citreus TaxID=84643 RepID=A0ABN1YPY0_9MICO